MLGYMATAENATIDLGDDELEHAQWLTRAELRASIEDGRILLPPSLSISYRLIETWFDAGNNGVLKDIRTNETS